jgi:threonyl-tRNA synthetase
MLIVGEQEATQGNISVRKHKEGDVGTLSVENLIEMVKQEISESISTFKV